MLDLDRQNVAYDAASELLCLLAKQPVWLPVHTLCEDLCCTNAYLAMHVETLKKRGLRVKFWRKDGKPVLAIDPDGWQTATAVAEAYLMRLERFSVAV